MSFDEDAFGRVFAGALLDAIMDANPGTVSMDEQESAAALAECQRNLTALLSAIRGHEQVLKEDGRPCEGGERCVGGMGELILLNISNGEWSTEILRLAALQIVKLENELEELRTSTADVPQEKESDGAHEEDDAV